MNPGGRARRLYAFGLDRGAYRLCARQSEFLICLCVSVRVGMALGGYCIGLQGWIRHHSNYYLP